MNSPDRTGELFPDADAIRDALRRRTHDALRRRLGPSASRADTVRPAERAKARGIGFGVDLVRAILDGRKTQTRRLVRPQPAAAPDANACPVARMGDLLYVREPWLKAGTWTLYAADASHAGRRFRPAMYMPRDAARLWLRVTGVRVQRLQSITPPDLLAEGLPPGQSLASVWDAFYDTPGHRYADDPWVWAIAFAVAPPAAPFPVTPAKG